MNESVNSFYRLVNPSFQFEWQGNSYEVKKATLEQVALYQQRASQYTTEKIAGSDSLLAAYAIWLILKDKIPTLTEEQILKDAPGDIDILELFTTLGFLNPAKIQAALKTISLQTTASSGQPSPTELVGLPETSAN